MFAQALNKLLKRLLFNVLYAQTNSDEKRVLHALAPHMLVGARAPPRLVRLFQTAKFATTLI